MLLSSFYCVALVPALELDGHFRRVEIPCCAFSGLAAGARLPEKTTWTESRPKPGNSAVMRGCRDHLVLGGLPLIF